LASNKALLSRVVAYLKSRALQGSAYRPTPNYTTSTQVYVCLRNLFG